MAWSAPKTWASGEVLTASDLNVFLRNNLLESEAAKAFSEGGYIVTSGENEVDQRTPVVNRVEHDESTGSTTYTDLATPGPSVEFTSGGGGAIVFWSADMNNGTGSHSSLVSVAIGGASAGEADAAASDNRCAQSTITAHVSQFWYYDGLNPGVNTATLKYRVGGSTSRFRWREIFVMPF